MTESDITRTIQQHLFEMLFIVHGQMRSVVKDSDAELSPLQVQILRSLVEHGPMTQNSLGDLLHKDKSQITRMIADLVSKGLVTKEPHPTDRRSFVVSTDAGVADTMEMFVAAEQALVAEMLRDAGRDDLEAFDRVLVLMKHNLDHRFG